MQSTAWAGAFQPPRVEGARPKRQRSVEPTGARLEPATSTCVASCTGPSRGVNDETMTGAAVSMYRRCSGDSAQPCLCSPPCSGTGSVIEAECEMATSMTSSMSASAAASASSGALPRCGATQRASSEVTTVAVTVVSRCVALAKVSRLRERKRHLASVAPDGTRLEPRSSRSTGRWRSANVGVTERRGATACES